MELSKLQQSIIDAPYDKTVVIAAAASGKTQTMTEKVRQLLRANINPKQIAVITFTNIAASELRSRLGEDYKDGLFVGTIHALANYMLSSSGINTRKVLDEENFDKLFEMVKENPRCIRHYEWVLLDEAQDSDKNQFDFIFNMIDPDCFFVVGDMRQCIYQFNGSRPELLASLARQPWVHSTSLNENYRNGYNILKFAKNIIERTGLDDDSVSRKIGNGIVREVPYSIDIIVDRILSSDKYSDWAILTRTNSQLEKVAAALSANSIPWDTFKQGELKKLELTERMNANTVKCLTIHSSKGLEFQNVIVIGARYRPSEELNVCYVAATRAKELLIWMTGQAKKRRY